MAETHVVSALVSKRSELAGIIADLEKRAARHRADLVKPAVDQHPLAADERVDRQIMRLFP